MNKIDKELLSVEEQRSEMGERNCRIAFDLKYFNRTRLRVRQVVISNCYM